VTSEQPPADSPQPESVEESPQAPATNTQPEATEAGNEAPATPDAVEAPVADAPAAPAAAAAPAAEAESEEAESLDEKAARSRRRERRTLSHGQAHIRATFNNTVITISDLQGNTILWTSGGSVGFKGSRKSTPYAAQVAAEQAARQAGEYGIRKVDVIVRGSGSGRETAVRTLQAMGLEVTGIKDVTPLPHNGCRPKKRRGN